MGRKKQKDISVSIGCVLQDDKVLMVMRSEAAQPDINLMWELPGGKVKEGEKPTDTAIREVKEETGYEAIIADFTPYTYSTFWEYKEYFLKVSLMCFECKCVRKMPDFCSQDPKIKEIEWKKIQEIDFSKVLPGSREFIMWIAEKHSIKLKPEQSQILSSYLRLECIDLKMNRKKFYNVSIDVNKDAETRYQVKRAWGRIDNPSRGNISTEFKTDSEMRHYILPILKERIAHNYFIRDYSGNFPLKTWLEQNKERIDNSQKKLF